MKMETLNRLLSAANEFDASDLHLVAGVPPAFRVNGEIIIADEDALTEEEITAMTDGLLNEQQKKKFESEWELCISILHSVAGRIRATFYRRNNHPEMSLRFCGDKVASRAELGLPEKINDLGRKPNGLVLITGPTGAGKTTTLNYLVDLINGERRCKIVTIEDPIEFVHENKRAIVVQQEVLSGCAFLQPGAHPRLAPGPGRHRRGRDARPRGHCDGADRGGNRPPRAGHHALAQRFACPRTHRRGFRRQRPAADHPAIANALQGIIAQDLLPAADRRRRVLAYELLVVNGAVRNLIRENQFHQLENTIQTGRKEGMVLMDNCLYDLYCKCAIT